MTDDPQFKMNLGQGCLVRSQWSLFIPPCSGPRAWTLHILSFQLSQFPSTTQQSLLHYYMSTQYSRVGICPFLFSAFILISATHLKIFLTPSCTVIAILLTKSAHRLTVLASHKKCNIIVTEEGSTLRLLLH